MGGKFISLLFVLFFLTSFTSTVLGQGRTPTVTQRRDALGVISTALQCRKKYYHKMVIYSTIRKACMLMRRGQTIRGECQKSKFRLKKSKPCEEYPQKFEPTPTINFQAYDRAGGELFSYPLLQFGLIFDGKTSPGLERVIFDRDCNAAGATTADTLRGYTEACTVNYSPPKQGFFLTIY